MNKTTTELATRAEAGAEAIKTNLTIDWEGMEREDLIALAQQALIVKLQSSWRKNGIPAGDHDVKAVEYKVGSRAPRTAKDPVALINALSPEKKAELLKALQEQLAAG